MPELTREGTVSVLHLGEGENRFSPDWMVEVADILDEVAAGEPTALVTSAEGKIWSNGLDLEWVQANPTEFQPYVSRAQHLMAKMLELPVPTVAAIQGHCFAAGAMLSLCHDQRVMRADRGFWCLPEVTINLPFTPGMDALVQAHLSPRSRNLAMTTGYRFGGNEAQDNGIVDDTAAEGDVLTVAIDRAAALVGANKDILGQIKRQMYAPVLAALRQD